MSRYKGLFCGVFLLLFVFFVCMPAAEAVPRPFGDETDAKSLIGKFWANRLPDPVEGIWTVKDAALSLELAIVRNTTEVEKDYEYLGIVTRQSGKSPWRTGDLCLVLKKGASSDSFSGAWLMTVLFFDQRMPTTLKLKPEGDGFTADYQGAFHQAMTYTGARVYPAGGPRVTSGTGFFVSPTLVVTVAHLVEGASQISVDFQGEKFTAQRVAVDKANDLAVLRVEGLESQVRPLAVAPARSVAVGERVYTAGFPTPAVLGRSLKFAEGLVNSATGLADDPRAFQVSVAVQPGLSGGPLLSGRGQVIGVVVNAPALAYSFYKGQTIPAGVNFAIKSGSLLALFGNLPEEIKTPPAESGASLDATQLAELARSAVVLIEVK